MEKKIQFGRYIFKVDVKVHEIKEILPLNVIQYFEAY